MRPVWIRTGILVAILAVVLLGDLAVRGVATRPPTELPVLPEVAEADIRKITLTRGDSTIELEPRGDGWVMTAPIHAEADRAAVRALFTAFLDPVPMDVRVDGGNLDRYGLDGGVRVDIEGADGPLSAFYVGQNGAGGASYVRFPDDDEVYLARIGGRHRYDQPPAAFRDHRVVGLPHKAIDRVVIAPAGGERVALTRPRQGEDRRGEPVFGPWVSEAGWPVDQEHADELAVGLAGLRGGALLSPDYPAGLDEPVAHVEVGAAGVTVAFVVGQTSEGAFAQRADRGDIYLVAQGLVGLLTRPPLAYRDRRFMTFDRAAVHRMALVEPLGTTVLEQDPASSEWRVVRPANVDIDLRTAFNAARILGGFRVDEIALVEPAEAGFPGDTRFEITGTDGRTAVLEVGGRVPGRQPTAVFVRTADQPDRIGVADARGIAAARAAFSR